MSESASVQKLTLLQANLVFEPFKLNTRVTDQVAKAELSFPPHPFFVSKKNDQADFRVLQMHQFCKMRNIPFSENEERFYKSVKQRVESKAYVLSVERFYRTMITD